MKIYSGVSCFFSECRGHVFVCGNSLHEHYGPYFEKPFFTFVGGKCCNTTISDPQQLKTVGVGLTFQPFVGATFTSFVGPTKVRKVAPTKESKVSTTVLRGQQFLLLGSQNLKVQQNFHNKNEKHQQFLMLGSLKMLGPTVFLQQKY